MYCMSGARGPSMRWDGTGDIRGLKDLVYCLAFRVSFPLSAVQSKRAWLTLLGVVARKECDICYVAFRLSPLALEAG